MIRDICGLLAMVMASLCPLLTHGATPRDNFESDRLLASAVTEIGSLNRDQLQAVIDYIASCEPTPGPERDFHCERATTTLQIKTSRAISLAQMRTSIHLVDKLIPWKSSGTGDENAKRIERRVDIFHTLMRAAAERYQALNVSDGRR